MICEAEVTISGLKFEKIEGKRTIQSIFLLDVKDGSCMEVTVSDDIEIDKEKLAKELTNYYRKEVVAYIDIENDFDRPNSNYVNVRFIRIENSKIT